MDVELGRDPGPRHAAWAAPHRTKQKEPGKKILETEAAMNYAPPHSTQRRPVPLGRLGELRDGAHRQAGPGGVDERFAQRGRKMLRAAEGRGDPGQERP